MTRKKHINKFLAPPPVPGQSRKFVYVYVFFLSLIVIAAPLWQGTKSRFAKNMVCATPILGTGGILFREHCFGRENSLCDPSTPPDEFLGPKGPKLETELKMSSRGWKACGPKSQKNQSRKRAKQWKFHCSTLFQPF